MSAEFDTDAVIKKSKTQIKREFQEQQAFVQQLIGLPVSQIDQFDIPEALRDQIKRAKQMQKSALKREIKYICKLLRQYDITALTAQLTSMLQPDRKAKNRLKQLEHWRDNLLSDQPDTANKTLMILEQQFTVDINHLKQLIDTAHQEERTHQPPKSRRALFKYLKTISE